MGSKIFIFFIKIIQIFYKILRYFCETLCHCLKNIKKELKKAKNVSIWTYFGPKNFPIGKFELFNFLLYVYSYFL